MRSVLSVFLLAAACSVHAQDPWESDGTISTAIPVTSPLRHEGRSIFPLYDSDHYKFELTTATTIVVETNRRPSNDEEALRVELLNSLYVPIAEGENSLAADAEPGTYYARIQAWDFYNRTVPSYTVTVSAFPQNADRFEPNNTMGTAKTLSRGVLHRFLNITPGFDEDWFVINPGTKGTTPTSTMIFANSTVRNVTIEVYDAFGNDETDFLGNQNGLIQDLTPGNHFIRVLNYGFEGAVPAYTLTYWTAGTPDSYEDDDTPATASTAMTQGAGHTPSGHQQYRNVFPMNDEDWVRFWVEDADNVQVVAFGSLGPDPLVEIYDATGTTRLAGPEAFITVYDDPVDGFYFARIRRDPNAAFDPNNVYRLDVSTIPIPRFTQGTLAGAVVSSPNTSPVNNATVQIISPVSISTKTASNGVYLLDSLPQGAYSIRVSASGFSTQTVSAEVGSAVTNLNFTLTTLPTTDLNNDGQVNAVDVQLVINGALGSGAAADVNNDGQTNAVDIQLVINGALGV